MTFFMAVSMIFSLASRFRHNKYTAHRVWSLTSQYLGHLLRMCGLVCLCASYSRSTVVCWITVTVLFGLAPSIHWASIASSGSLQAVGFHLLFMCVAKPKAAMAARQFVCLFTNEASTDASWCGGAACCGSHDSPGLCSTALAFCSTPPSFQNVRRRVCLTSTFTPTSGYVLFSLTSPHLYVLRREWHAPAAPFLFLSCHPISPCLPCACLPTCLPCACLTTTDRFSIWGRVQWHVFVFVAAAVSARGFGQYALWRVGTSCDDEPA